MPNKNPAPLLPDATVIQIKEIARDVRKGIVAPLIGSGISHTRGIPLWAELIENVIKAWRQWDTSISSEKLSTDDYVRMIKKAFRDNDLAVVSYLRSRIDAQTGLSFGQVLFSALYSVGPDEFLVPEPNDIYRHIVKLFERCPRRIWTTNYDDLIEEAAHELGVTSTYLDPIQRKVSGDLLVAHLHGFLPPRRPGRDYPDESKTKTILTLSEDDFNLIASDTIGWTNRGFHQLFDEHHVLILGMSLDDPNVRRVLAANLKQSGKRKPHHFAVMSPMKLNGAQFPNVTSRDFETCIADANEFRMDHWRRYGVEVVPLSSHDLTLAFLMRLRYESFGKKRGDLWGEGAERGYKEVAPWGKGQQEVAKLVLDNSISSIQEEFSVPRDELVELGIFLLNPDRKTLDLTFRGWSGREAKKGERSFSGNPDNPTGVAGRVFASGEGVRVLSSDILHDYGLDPGLKLPSSTYSGIIALPIIDWKKDGAPMGVIYVTVANTDGVLFGLPETTPLASGEKSLEQLYRWMHVLAIKLIELLRNRK